MTNFLFILPADFDAIKNIPEMSILSLVTDIKFNVTYKVSAEYYQRYSCRSSVVATCQNSFCHSWGKLLLPHAWCILDGNRRVDTGSYAAPIIIATPVIVFFQL